MVFRKNKLNHIIILYKGGFVYNYLAGFLIIVCYEIGKNIDGELSMSALGNAIALRGRHKGVDLSQ